MGRYYYVCMKNSTFYRDENDHYKPTETGKILEPIARNISLGYSEPSALAVYGVRSRIDTKRERGFFGFEYDKKNVVDDPVFIICEDNDNGYLEEVVTGNKYKKVDTNNYAECYSNKLRLSIVSEIPSGKVSEQLRSLSNSGVMEKYVNKIHVLDKAIAIGYQRDVQRRKNTEIQKQRDDSYIKSFRKRYGK